MKNFLKKIFTSKPQYDLDSIQGIMSIQIPKYKPLQGMGNPSNNIEYILQKKATEHKRNGRMDLAIACLRKSNEIFPHSNFSWPEKDYMRLVEYLKQDRQFDEARREGHGKVSVVLERWCTTRACHYHYCCFAICQARSPRG
jgi:hypothetical protein